MSARKYYRKAMVNPDSQGDSFVSTFGRIYKKYFTLPARLIISPSMYSPRV